MGSDSKYDTINAMLCINCTFMIISNYPILIHQWILETWFLKEKILIFTMFKHYLKAQLSSIYSV